MLEPFDPLGRADQPAGAADVDLAFLGDGFGIAHWAVVGKHKGLTRLLARQILDDLRNHIARALDADAVADAQAQPLDLVGYGDEEESEVVAVEDAEA